MQVLLNIQRKELHDILKDRGVDPSVTKWTNEKKGWTSSSVDTLQVGPCHFLFNADSDGTYSIHMKPGADGAGIFGGIGYQWDSVKRFFDAWSAHVKRELEQGDLWQQYAAYIPPERLISGLNNAPFSHKEAEHVAHSIHVLRNHVEKTTPNYASVAEQFDSQFERIASRAKEGAGRIDWSNQFVGMLISLCMSLSLAPDAASELWHFWTQVINCTSHDLI